LQAKQVATLVVILEFSEIKHLSPSLQLPHQLRKKDQLS